VRFLRRRSPNRQSLFEAARKSPICTHKPEQSTQAQEKCDSSEGWKPEAESKSLICERENSRWAFSCVRTYPNSFPFSHAYPPSLFYYFRVMDGLDASKALPCDQIFNLRPSRETCERVSTSFFFNRTSNLACVAPK